MKRFFLAATRLLIGTFLIASVGCVPPSMESSGSVGEAAGAISAEKFEQVFNQDKLVVVKFGATWCGPCRRVDDELASLAGELPPDVEVLKIDVDENPELAQEFQITGIPRILLVRSGEVLADETGYMSKSQLQSWIGEHRISDIQENPYAK
jgi:thioredoxin 1